MKTIHLRSTSLQTESEKLNAISVANDVRVCINAHTRGEMGYDVLAIALKGFALTSPDAAWEVLSLLDQYHRRGALTDEVFRALKEQITRVAFAGQSSSSATVRNAMHSNVRASAAHREPSEPTRVRSYAQREPTHAQHTQDNIQDNASEPLLVIKEPPFNDVKHTEPAQENTAAPIEPQTTPTTNTPSVTPIDVPQSTSPSQAHSALSAGLSSRSDAASPISSRTTKQAALASAIAPGKTLDGRFTIESALSFGRCTAVFRARDRGRTDDRNSFVALKILLIATPDALKQFEHEQQVAQRLAHPQLVNAQEMHHDNGLPFFTMELIEGKTLGELLESAPPKRAQTQTIIAKLVDALAYLHQQRIAHGDINPDNVMISNSGEVKLIDYGAANDFSIGNNHANSSARLNTPPTLPAYASYQRLDGQAAEPDDDIFSLSCIAYQMLTGQHPFNHLAATQARTTGRSPIRIPELRPQQWLSLQRGLAWERGDRVASVEEWFAGFSGARDVEIKQPTPAPEFNTPPPLETISAPPRPPSSARRAAAPLPPSQYQYIAPVPKPRRWLWPTVVATVFSVVAAVGIIQSEFGFQLRSQLAAQTAGIKTDSNRSEAQSSPSTPAVDEAATSTDANSATTANEAAIGNSAANAAPPNQSASISAANNTNIDNALAAKSIEGASAVSPTSAATPKDTVKDSGSTDSSKATKPSEAHGRIGFSRDTFVASKHDSYARITIDRDNGTAGKVTFAWWTEPGTAEEGKDYMSYGRKTEVLGSGKRRMTVFVPLIADLSKSNGHVFFVWLGDASNGLTLGRITRAKVIISDD